MRNGARRPSRRSSAARPRCVALVRREEAVVDAGDAEQRDVRAVAQGDGRVAARRHGAARDVADGVSRAVEGDPVVRRLAETEDAVVARRGRSVVPGRLIAARKADQRLSAPRGALDRIAGRSPDSFVAAAADDRLVAEMRIDELGAAAADDRLAGAAADRHIAGAAPHPVAGAAPARPVAGAALDDRLVAEMRIDELIAGASGDRVARGAAGRHIAGATSDAVAS